MSKQVDAVALVDDLIRAAAHLEPELEEALNEHGLTRPSYLVLLALLGADEQRGEDEVARAGQAVLGERLLELGLEVRGRADEVVDEGRGISLLGHTSCSKALRSSDYAGA